MKANGRKFLLLTVILALMLCGPDILWANAVNSGQAKINKVVIDPGHGGKDPGCVYGSVHEKDIALSIGMKLGELIKQNFPDTEVIYTRDKDEYIDLHRRGIIANSANADLFISIHINAANNKNARGTSTHVMGMEKSNQNLEVSMRENDVITYEDDYSTKYEGYNPGDPASYIMFSLMQYAYQDQSMMMAEIVQNHFKSDLPLPDRGTSQDPFLVLWRTSMPSVLCEIGFLSNETDRAYITTDKGQNEAARSLFNAFSEYKSKVEGRTSVVTLREPHADTATEQQPEQPAKGRRRSSGNTAVQADPVSVQGTANASPQSSSTIQSPSENILFYVQLCFLSQRKPSDSSDFKSYRGRVVEKSVSGRGFRYLVGGVSNYQEILKLQAEVRKEFPDAYIIAYEDGREIDTNAARRKTGQ